MRLELPILLKRLFNLEGNHNPEKLLDVRESLVAFININELYVDAQDDEDFELARDAIRFIDALNTYAETSNKEKGYSHLRSFFKRLEKTDKWNYYDLHLFVGSINFIATVDETIALATTVIKIMDNFKSIRDTTVLEGIFACNMCSRILYSKYFEDSTRSDLANHFDHWFSKIERLREINDYDLGLPFIVTEIREAIFYQKEDKLEKLSTELYEAFGEEAAGMIVSESDSYVNCNVYKMLKEKVS